MARNAQADDPFGDDWGMPGATQTESDEMPESSEVDPERSPFLKPFHLKNREGTIDLISASGGTEYSDVVLHVRVGNQNFRLGLRTFDPGYTACRAKFGSKKSDWHGMLRYRIMPHKGNPNGYVAIRPISLRTKV